MATSSANSNAYNYLVIQPTNFTLAGNGGMPSFTIIGSTSSQNQLDIWVILATDKNTALEPSGAIDSPETTANKSQVSAFKIATVDGNSSINQVFPAADDDGTQKTMLTTAWKNIGNNLQIYYQAALVKTGTPAKSSCLVAETSKDFIPFLFGNRYDAKVLFSPVSIPTNLPWLYAVGNKLVAEGTDANTSLPVILRGVNLSGLDYYYFFNPYPFNPAFYKQIERPITDVGKFAKTFRNFLLTNSNWQSSCRSRNLNPVDAAGISADRLSDIKKWGANVIRLPLNVDWVINGFNPKELGFNPNSTPKGDQLSGIDFSRPASTYCQDIDRVVGWAADNGLRVILVASNGKMVDKLKNRSVTTPNATVDWLYRQIDKAPLLRCLPDNNDLVFWSILASRYQNCSHVMYDIMTEPHALSEPLDNKTFELDEWVDETLYYTGRKFNAAGDWAAEWKLRAANACALIKTISSKALVFVSGINGASWAASLIDMPILDAQNIPIANVVYSSHCYYNGWSNWGGTGGKGVANKSDLADLKKSAGIGYKKNENLSDKYPVFFGEWGVDNFEARVLEKIGINGTPQGADANSKIDKNSPLADKEVTQLVNRWGRKKRGDKPENIYSRLQGKYIPPDSNLDKFGQDFLLLLKQYTLAADGSYNGFTGFTAWGYADGPHIIFRDDPAYDGQYKSNDKDCACHSIVSPDKKTTISTLDCPTSYGQLVVQEIIRLGAVEVAAKTALKTKGQAVKSNSL